ncbi:hypothetical protein NFI96_021564, partial [Prochilodus magdalenae]
QRQRKRWRRRQITVATTRPGPNKRTAPMLPSLLRDTGKQHSRDMLSRTTVHMASLLLPSLHMARLRPLLEAMHNSSTEPHMDNPLPQLHMLLPSQQVRDTPSLLRATELQAMLLPPQPLPRRPPTLASLATALSLPILPTASSPLPLQRKVTVLPASPLTAREPTPSSRLPTRDSSLPMQDSSRLPTEGPSRLHQQRILHSLTVPTGSTANLVPLRATTSTAVTVRVA